MCGFVGIIGVSDAAVSLAFALQAIQHRGQDAAGVATWHNGRLHLHKDTGLVSAALPPERVAALPGGAGIAHVRYPTQGGGSREEAQPFYTRRPGILLCHNGNLTNAASLEGELLAQGLHTLSTSDSELILLALAEELTRDRNAGHSLDDLTAALGRLMARLRGSYAVAAVLELDGEPTLVAFRDPHGVRPGVWGRRADGAWMVASESVALDALGFALEGELPAGHLLALRGGRPAEVRPIAPRAAHPCVFERIYFARADSVLDGERVNQTRAAFGRALAARWRARGLEADVVIPIPDTSRPAAEAMSVALGLPTGEGFIKNRYSGRTFIMPDQTSRDQALRVKLNPIREAFEGKRVILLDDSIVRGSTIRRLVRLARDMRPAAIHVAVYSPPVRHPCFYGIDMPSSEELLAAEIADDAVLERALCDRLGVDSVTYLPLADLRTVVGGGLCGACFDGTYPIPVSEAERVQIRGDRRA